MEALEQGIGLGFLHPFPERAHRPPRPIAVIDLQGQLALPEPVLHARERLCHIAQQQTFGRGVAGHRPASEFVGTGVADVLKNAGVDSAKMDESGRRSW